MHLVRTSLLVISCKKGHLIEINYLSIALRLLICVIRLTALSDNVHHVGSMQHRSYTGNIQLTITMSFCSALLLCMPTGVFFLDANLTYLANATVTFTITC